MVVCTISGTSVHVHKVAYCSTEGTSKPSPSKARTRTICSNSMIVYCTEVRRYVISNVITFVSYLTFVLMNNKYESTSGSTQGLVVVHVQQALHTTLQHCKNRLEIQYVYCTCTRALYVASLQPISIYLHCTVHVADFSLSSIPMYSRASYP